ncbi:MAG: hypothetical protein Q9M94_02280 [Candidatus Gracilibacteria bacterium]|nr:hypothetical protein [Candidatus Gracilibacteria bacterium]MDQ7023807.1 hypothetical protein [Candidatus Gracilibacteria bacterium]
MEIEEEENKEEGIPKKRKTIQEYISLFNSYNNIDFLLNFKYNTTQINEKETDADRKEYYTSFINMLIFLIFRFILLLSKE